MPTRFRNSQVTTPALSCLQLAVGFAIFGLPPLWVWLTTGRISVSAALLSLFLVPIAVVVYLEWRGVSEVAVESDRVAIWRNERCHEFARRDVAVGTGLTAFLFLGGLIIRKRGWTGRVFYVPRTTENFVSLVEVLRPAGQADSKGRGPDHA